MTFGFRPAPSVSRIVSRSVVDRPLVAARAVTIALPPHPYMCRKQSYQPPPTIPTRHARTTERDQRQTDQESRSMASPGEVSVKAMDLSIHGTFLPHSDPDEALAFYRDVLGFEVRSDVG